MRSTGIMVDIERALEPLVARAVAIAAHADQTDKAGEPYWTHPARVAGAVERQGGSVHAVAAAWLHDVVEDTPLTFEDLRVIGFDNTTVGLVDALTRREDESHEEAVKRAATRGPGARLVKRCDVQDNMDPNRLALLDVETQRRLFKKYSNALAILNG